VKIDGKKKSNYAKIESEFDMIFCKHIIIFYYDEIGNPNKNMPCKYVLIKN